MKLYVTCPHCQKDVVIEPHSLFPLEDGYNDFLEKCPECEKEMHIEIEFAVHA